MLGAGHHTIGRADVRALEAADLGGGHGGTEEGIFAGAFDDRPQRASRAMSSMGPKVQRMPAARASLAAMVCARSATEGSHDEAMASGTGKIVW